MKLIYDARLIALQYTGLGRYAASLLRALLEAPRRPDLEIEVLLDSACDRDGMHYLALQSYIERGLCQVQVIDAPPISFRQHFSVARWVNQRGADHYFYPHFDVPLGLNVATSFVVHDLIPLLVDGYVQKFGFAKKLYFKQMLRHNVATAESCYAVSETTRRDILDVTGERWIDKLKVAYEGPVLSTIRQENSLLINQSRPYLFYIGDRRPHKNIRRIIDLYILLRDRHGYPGRLILAGSKQNYDFDLDAYIAQREDIDVLGNVSDSDLLDLYAGCDALMFLSEYEGFGLPVVEAARFNRKMVLSDGGALPEIAPPNACVISRNLPLEIAATQVALYLADPVKYDLFEYTRRYSWEQSVAKIFPYAIAEA